MRLTRFEKSQLDVLMDALLPTGGQHLPQGALDVHAGEYVMRFASRMPLRNRVGLRCLLVLIAISPIWYLGRLSSLGGLSFGERTELLHRLVKSPSYLIRQTIFVTREVACMAYGSDPGVRAAIDRAAGPKGEVEV